MIYGKKIKLTLSNHDSYLAGVSSRHLNQSLGNSLFHNNKLIKKKLGWSIV